MSVFLELLLKGKAITWIIFFLGLISLIVIIERILHFHRAQINVPEFMRGVVNVLKRHNPIEAITICEETPGPVAQILRAAILRAGKGEKAMRRAVQEAGLSEIPRLERSLKFLETIAHLAPLMGLLGTVVGMISIFQSMEHAGTFVDTKTLAAGIWQALLSTAAGLTVAIPAHGFYNYFLGRIDGFVLDMEKASSELIHFLLESNLQLDTAELQPNGTTDQQVSPPSDPV